MAEDLPHSSASEYRIWRFGDFAFDESRWALSKDGRPIALEGKPLDILLELLRQSGQIVTKAELLDRVWPGLHVIEGSLTTAVSKLRKALDDREGAIVVTVPRVGYRFGLAVSVAATPRPSPAPLRLEQDDAVPGRSAWRLDLRLSSSGACPVWRARHEKTGELRVFKFADDGDGLRRLKREVAISRLLRDVLGERPDLVPVLEWNFDARPWFVESAYGGPDLTRWAEDQGGLAAIPLETRLAVLATVAETIAAAHNCGVLHQDLKPANILAAVDRTGAWQARVIDFGSAALDEPDRLARAGITATAFDGDIETLSGTALWMAPELLAGAPASARSDIYALGVMLYQMMVGDLRKPLSPGWEAGIGDPLLRTDIAEAAAGDPARRLDSAATFARRLREIEARRRDHRLALEAEQRAREAEDKLARSRARRPWVIAAGAASFLGLAASLTFAFVATDQRAAAERHAADLEAMNRFLSSDLLARSSPYVSGQPDESLIGAIKASAAQIDARFGDSPAIAARLYQTIARALDSRNDWAGSREAYQRAASLWEKAEGKGSRSAIRTRLQLAMMEARSYQAGTLEAAKTTLAAQEEAISARGGPDPELAMWLASAKGMVALIDNDAAGAEAHFGEAQRIAETIDGFDPAELLTLRQRRAFALFRLGRSQEAENLFRQLVTDYRAIGAANDPAVLRLRLNLAQTLMGQGKFTEAITQADALEPDLVRVLGSDNELALQLLATRGQSYGSLERWDDAIRDTTNLNQRATAMLGEGSFFAVVSLADRALAQCRSGRATEGLSSAALAHSNALTAFGPDAGLTQGVAFVRAHCLILAGRHGEAVPLLDGIDTRKVAELTADPHWGGNVALARAQLAHARGDAGETRRQLELARPAFEHSATDPYQARVWKTLDTGSRH